MTRWKEWAQQGATLGFVLWAFACSSGGKTTEATGGMSGNGGDGGMAQGSSSSSVASSGMASSSSVGAGGFGGAPMAFVCDPPAEPGSLYELAAKSYDLNDIGPMSMCKVRGKVALIVNTAAI
jgi:hypothetical protein